MKMSWNFKKVSLISTSEDVSETSKDYDGLLSPLNCIWNLVLQDHFVYQ